jgi:hypothetical protein
MNDWRKERDLLVEESMAFAQRLRGDAPKRIDFPQTVAKPLSQGIAAQPKPMAVEVRERDVIQGRLANFKANQEKFQQEREEYFTRTMANARAMQRTPRSREDDKPSSR